MKQFIILFSLFLGVALNQVQAKTPLIASAKTSPIPSLSITVSPVSTTYTVGQSVTVNVTGGTSNINYTLMLYDGDPYNSATPSTDPDAYNSSGANSNTTVLATGQTSTSFVVYFRQTTTTSNAVFVLMNDDLSQVAVSSTFRVICPTVSIAALPSLTVGQGTSVTLTASAGQSTGQTSFTWSNGQTGTSINFVPASTTTLSLTSLGVQGGCSATASAAITVTSVVCNLTATIAGNLTLCPGGSTTLTASGAGTGGTYQWQGGPASVSYVVSSVGFYSVTATSASNCTAVRTVEVISRSRPTVIVTPLPSLTVCPGNSVTLTAAGTAGGVTGLNRIATSTARIAQGVAPPPSAITYLWSNGSANASINFIPASTTVLSVTVNDGYCSSTVVSTTVTVNPAVTASIAGNRTICAGTSTTLTASGGTSYSWTGGISGATLSVSAVGPYSVTVTNTTTGCFATTSVTITVNPAVTASIAGTLTICPGSSAQLTGSGAGNGGSYRWSSGQLTAAISVTNTGPYTVTATSAAGCSGTATVTINTQSGAPLAEPTFLSASSSVVCVGDVVSVTSLGLGTYQWYKDGPSGVPVSLGASQRNAVLSLNGVQVEQSGKYTVELTTSGCGSATSTSFMLTVNPLPTVTISFPTSASVNPVGPVVTVPVGQGLSYQVFGGGSNGRYERKIIEATINGYILFALIENRDGVFLIDRAGPYTIKVTDANGCSRTVTGEIVGK